uniref:phage head closure protein n=1 Tax=Klebsiella pneumoniae TaxID=573 RepID=UPI001F4AE784
MGCSGCAKRREWLKKWTKIAYERATGKRADSSAEREQNPTTGAVINTWRDVATLWAEVAPLSAREFIAAQASQGEVTTRITIRYR